MKPDGDGNEPSPVSLDVERLATWMDEQGLSPAWASRGVRGVARPVPEDVSTWAGIARAMRDAAELADVTDYDG